MKTNELSIGWAMMQQNPAEAVRRVYDNVMNWSRQRSDTFSTLTGETFTHGQVLAAHAAVLGLLMACTAAEILSSMY